MQWLLLYFGYMIWITKECFLWWKNVFILSGLLLMVMTCMMIMRVYIIHSSMWNQNKSSSVQNMLIIIVMYRLIYIYIYVCIYDKCCSINKKGITYMWTMIIFIVKFVNYCELLSMLSIFCTKFGLGTQFSQVCNHDMHQW